MLNNLIEQFYHDAAKATNEQALFEVAQNYLSQDVKWCVAHPINDLKGCQEVVSDFLKPLFNAMPDVERKPFVAVSSLEGYRYDGEQAVKESAEGYWVNSTGYFIGTFQHSLFDIPPTQRSLYLRYTEMVRVENNKITQCYLIPDYIDAMNQAGVNPLRSSLGHDGLILPATATDGLKPESVTQDESGMSAKLVLDMLECLGRYDGKSLQSMDLENYWYDDFMWYGPGGIGTTRGINGFRAHHQGPFLRGFPDRSVDIKTNFVAAGNYASTGGWPHMSATHTGDAWLGMPPTGKELSLRVMDIWRREGKLLKENWVGIDIIHMLLQMGLDVFGLMREQQANKK